MSKKQEVKNVEIKGKAIGRNVILEIDGKKYSRAFKSREDRQKILADVEKYNNKNTKTLKNAIIKSMETPTKTRAKKAEKAKKVMEKVTKTQTKPKATKASVKEEELEKAKELLTQAGFNVSKATSTPRRGEY